MALAAPAFSEVKVGVVEYGRLFSESPQAKALKDSLDAEFAPRLQQLMTQERTLKARAEKLQKDSVTMTEEQRNAAQKELSDSAYELDRKGQQLKSDSEAKRKTELGKLERVLANEVREYAKAQNFDIILMDGVIYAAPSVNITDAVMQLLQARAAKPGAPPTGAVTRPKP